MPKYIARATIHVDIPNPDTKSERKVISKAFASKEEFETSKEVGDLLIERGKAFKATSPEAQEFVESSKTDAERRAEEEEAGKGGKRK